MNKLAWYRPRIGTVEDVGPFLIYKLLTLIDGRVVIVPGIPIAINSTNAQKKSHHDEQNRRYQTEYRQRGSGTNKHDRLRATKVWLREFEEMELLVDMKFSDVPVTGREFTGIKERNATERVKSTFKKHRPKTGYLR